MYEVGTLNKKLIIAGILLGVILLIVLIVFLLSKPKPETKTYDEKTIQVGQKYEINMSHIDVDYEKLDFLTSNERILTVNNSGLVKGISPGKATVIIKSKKHEYVIQDFVVIPAEDIKEIILKENQLELTKGEKLDFTENIENFDMIISDINYKTSDKEIISIDKNGIIKAKKMGQAEITVTAGDITEVCIVIVNDEVKKEATEKKEEPTKTQSTINKNNNNNKNQNNNSNKSNNTNINPTSVTLNASSKVIYTNYPKTNNNTFKLSATVNPSNATNKKIIYKSSNTSVAVVSSSGVVTAKKVGTAYITATASNGIGKRMTVTVRSIANSIGYTVSTTPLMSTGHNLTNNTAVLTATFNPSNTYFTNVNWTTGNSNIATVTKTSNNKATLVMKKPGTVKITATTNGNPVKKTYSKDLVIKGLLINVWKTGGTKYERTRSSVTYSYVKDAKINYNISLYPSTNLLNRKSISVTSSNSSVLSCSSSNTYCNIKGKGTTTLKFTYNSDPRYKSFVNVTIN